MQSKAYMSQINLQHGTTTDRWGYTDMKVGWLSELCRWVRGACHQCAHLSLASVETGGWESCDWIWELWQQHAQESSGSVGAGWSETWAGCDKESCSSRAWSEQWKWRWWKLFWYQGMDGYSEADEYGNSKTWILNPQILSTEANYHIYTNERPVINVKGNFCA